MMAEKRFWRPFVIASFVASVGLLATPVGTSVTWATSHDKPQMMQKKPTMKAPAQPAAAMPAPQVLTVQPPTTLDSYVSYVGDQLNVESMKVPTSGVADLKLTIGKDGSVQQTEIVRLEGPAALRNQIMSMLSQMKFLPLPANANVDVLVVDATVAFNYPGSDLMDRMGQRAR